MVARHPHSVPDAPAETGEVEFAGWDPYIVALTAAEQQRTEPSDHVEHHAPDTRKGQLMAWLREHGA